MHSIAIWVCFLLLLLPLFSQIYQFENSAHPYSSYTSEFSDNYSPVGVVWYTATFYSSTRTESGYDFVNLRSGSSTGPILYRNSGSNWPDVNISSTVGITVELSSDASLEFWGVRVTLKALPNGAPTLSPSATPSPSSSLKPSSSTTPTRTPAPSRTAVPTSTWFPTTAIPVICPSAAPFTPTKVPSVKPTNPTLLPTLSAFPTNPSRLPTVQPSNPSVTPSIAPSYGTASICANCSGACANRDSIVLPSYLTSTGWGAFLNCANLKKVVIPSTITTIDANAFAGCSNLVEISIPNSVTSIGDYAFYLCSKLQTVTLPALLTGLGSNVFWLSGLVSINIPPLLSAITNGLFLRCYSLTTVTFTLPSSVTYINSESFRFCSSLASIVLPSPLTSISTLAFSDCSNLASVSFPSTLTSIDSQAFQSSGLTSLTLPSSLVSLGYQVFGYSYSLTTVTILSGLNGAGIPTNSFYSCSSLTTVTFSSKITYIGDNAFGNCLVLDNVMLPSSVTSLGNSVFSGCIGLKSLEFGKNIKDISTGTCYGCSSLVTLTFKGNIERIRYGAFKKCVALQYVVIPSSVVLVEEEAFAFCSSLSCLVTSGSYYFALVASNAFYGCPINLCLPTSQPSSQPSVQPTIQPTFQPSLQPMRLPSYQPTAQPSYQPISLPSRQPSRQPTSRPVNVPSSQPANQPSKQPLAMPSCQPSGKPSLQPSAQPSLKPRNIPTAQPSSQPSQIPSHQPTSQPMMLPSSQPSIQPSKQPSGCPSSQPILQPSMQPKSLPTIQPSCKPSKQPQSAPSGQPSRLPTQQPTRQPFRTPSVQPTAQPTDQPYAEPSSQPSLLPSRQPSAQPTRLPSSQPSYQPSSQPVNEPSRRPSCQPSMQPLKIPSSQPSEQPSQIPFALPSIQPSRQPVMHPTVQPSETPTTTPTNQPTRSPSTMPSRQPSSQPTRRPSAQPSRAPSRQPSSFPSCQPTRVPSTQPSKQPRPGPTSQPSKIPSTQPVASPTRQPSAVPTMQPFNTPSNQPSRLPTMQPSRQPHQNPSTQPSNRPSSSPSSQPSSFPTLSAIRCSRGTYYAAPPINRCVKCPMHTNTSTRGNIGVESCSVDAGYHVVTNAATGLLSVMPCPEGSFSSGGANSECTVCPIGSFSESPGTEQCLPCAPGTIAAVVNSTNCSTCPLGTYSPGGGGKCINCPTGTYSSVPGAKMCTNCGLGTANNITGRIEPCDSCLPGTFSSTENASVCTLCAPGSSAKLAEASTCDLCAIGFYSSVAGSNSCQSCGLGKITATVGSSLVAQCVNPLPNFVLGFVCLAAAIALYGKYLVQGKLNKAAFVRNVSFISPMIDLCVQVGKLLNEHVKKRNEYVSKSRLPPIVKVTVFAVGSILILLIYQICNFIVLLNQVVFLALIVYKGFASSYSLSDLQHQLNMMLSTVAETLQLPPTIAYGVAYPAIVLLHLLSFVSFDGAFAAVAVTCEGAKAPVELLINFVILTLVIAVIASGYLILWNLSFASINMAFIKSQIEVRQFFSRPLFLCIPLLSFVYLNPFQSALRYLLTLVSIKPFTLNHRVLHSISPSCNTIPGYPQFDNILGYSSSLIALVAIPPTLFVMVEVIAPTSILAVTSNRIVPDRINSQKQLSIRESSSRKSGIMDSKRQISTRRISSRISDDTSSIELSLGKSSSVLLPFSDNVNDEGDEMTGKDLQIRKETNPLDVDVENQQSSSVKGTSDSAGAESVDQLPPHGISKMIFLLRGLISWIYQKIGTWVAIDLWFTRAMKTWLVYLSNAAFNASVDMVDATSESEKNYRRRLTHSHDQVLKAAMEVGKSQNKKTMTESAVAAIVKSHHHSMKSKMKLQARWEESLKKSQQTTFAALCHTVFEEVKLPDEKHNPVVMFLENTFNSIMKVLVFSGYLHVLSASGRKNWRRILQRYVLFFAVCCGFWTDQAVEVFQVFDVSNTMPNIDVSDGIGPILSIIVGSRVILMQLFGGWACVFSVWAMLQAPTPLFVYSSRLHQCLPPIIQTHCVLTAVEQERELFSKQHYMHSSHPPEFSPEAWIIAFSSVVVFFEYSRLLPSIFAMLKLIFVLTVSLIVGDSRVLAIKIIVAIFSVSFLASGLSWVVYFGKYIKITDNDIKCVFRCNIWQMFHLFSVSPLAAVANRGAISSQIGSDDSDNDDDNGSDHDSVAAQEIVSGNAAAAVVVSHSYQGINEKENSRDNARVGDGSTNINISNVEWEQEAVDINRSHAAATAATDDDAAAMNYAYTDEKPHSAPGAAFEQMHSDSNGDSDSFMNFTIVSDNESENYAHQRDEMQETSIVPLKEISMSNQKFVELDVNDYMLPVFGVHPISEVMPSSVHDIAPVAVSAPVVDDCESGTGTDSDNAFESLIVL